MRLGNNKYFLWPSQKNSEKLRAFLSLTLYKTYKTIVGLFLLEPVMKGSPFFLMVFEYLNNLFALCMDVPETFQVMLE